MNRIQLFAAIIVCIGSAALYFSHESRSRHVIEQTGSQANSDTIKTAHISAGEYMDD